MMHKTCSINYGHLADLQRKNDNNIPPPPKKKKKQQQTNKKTLLTTDLNEKNLSFDKISPHDFYFFPFLFNLYLL